MKLKKTALLLAAITALNSFPVAVSAYGFGYETQATSETRLDIPDSKLREAIVKTLIKYLEGDEAKARYAARDQVEYALYEGDLNDLAKITELDLEGIIGQDISKIQTLSGLNLLHNLASVNVSGTQVKGLAYVNDLMNKQDITELKHTKTANLVSKVSSTKELLGLSGLKTLRMTDQNITNLTDIGRLGLNTLILDGNNISDVSGIAGKRYTHASLNNQTFEVVAVKDTDGSVTINNPIDKSQVHDLQFTNITLDGEYLASSDSIYWKATAAHDKATITFQGKVGGSADFNYTGTVTVNMVDAIEGVAIEGVTPMSVTEGDKVDLDIGVTAKDYKGTNLTQYIVMTHNVPVDESGNAVMSGQYKAQYKVVINGKQYTSVTRNVEVKQKEKPNTPPVITVYDIEMGVNQRVELSSYLTVNDEQDGVIPNSQVRISHTIPTKIVGTSETTKSPGDFTATYAVTDSGGLTTSKTIKVKVKEQAEDTNNKPPTIDVQSVIKVKVGDIFEPFVYAKISDPEDGNLYEDNVELEHRIPLERDGDFYTFDKEGNYSLTYIATDRQGASTRNSTRIEVTLSDKDKKLEKEKEDNKSPILKLKVKDAELQIGDEFKILDFVQASDEDKDINEKITYKGIPTERRDRKEYVSKVGEFEVTIKVEDKFGETDTEYLDVIVVSKEELDYSKLPTNLRDFEKYVDGLSDEAQQKIVKEFANRLPIYATTITKGIEDRLGLSERLYSYKLVNTNGVNYYEFEIEGIKAKEPLRVMVTNLPKGNGIYTDMKNHWSSGTVQRISTIGLMVGKETSKFVPNDKLTHEEAMVILNRITVSSGMTPLRDRNNVNGLTNSITNRWGYNDVKSYLSYMDPKQTINTLTPISITKQITREELAQLIQPVLEGSGLKKGGTNTKYVDASTIQYTQAVQLASSYGLFRGDTLGKFNPKSGLTRAEMASVAERLYDLLVK